MAEVEGYAGLGFAEVCGFGHALEVEKVGERAEGVVAGAQRCVL